jgi:hypothetical protein
MSHEDGLHGSEPDHLKIAVGTAEVDALVKDALFLDKDQCEGMLDELLRLPEGTERADRATIE